MDSHHDCDQCIITESIPIKRSKLLSSYTPSTYKRINMPGDRHCIARYFSEQFKKLQDRCMDRLQSKFQENREWYLQFSTKTEDYTQSQVFDSDVMEMSIEVFAGIYRAKANIFSGTEGVSKYIMGEQRQLEKNILIDKYIKIILSF